jgi:hypothetical protein
MHLVEAPAASALSLGRRPCAAAGSPKPCRTANPSLKHAADRGIRTQNDEEREG